MEDKSESRPLETLVRCIGSDRKVHVREPHKRETYCGVPVLKSNPSDRDCVGLFSCYECTY